MTSAKALQEAKAAGRSGLFEVSSHALKRMMERNVTRRDIQLALQSATAATHEGGEKWRLDGGKDDDGDDLGVVIVLAGRRIVVTVF